jgi:hypothetical protein
MTLLKTWLRDQAPPLDPETRAEFFAFLGIDVPGFEPVKP